MNRILIRPEELRNNASVHLSDQRATHVLQVLRARPGQQVRVGLLNGATGTAIIQKTSNTSVQLECCFNGPTPPLPRIDVLLALPRPKVMRRLWAPLAMLGVHRIILTNAAKVERNYFDTHWLTPETYTPRLIEGLAQSGDTRVPEVTIARRFKPLLEDALETLCPSPTLKLCAHPAEDRALPPINNTQQVLLAIGPEGGWTEFELSLLEENGFHQMALGWRRLRTDIACTALLSIIDAHRTTEEELNGHNE
ncbi:MAG: 16S rRNA (uracil(1498)-N(3))-methyltransferase [Kiritimatiellae bacterium]|nr:16S rRNA (uracil(1498)-N(3))-methyltransferase [Kiritimatiellia bacterium]